MCVVGSATKYLLQNTEPPHTVLYTGTSFLVLPTARPICLVYPWNPLHVEEVNLRKKLNSVSKKPRKIGPDLSGTKKTVTR